MGDQHIPSNVTFPKAKSIAVLNCSRHAIFNSLTPYIFPHVHTIHYLSAHPGSYGIHNRFEGVMWEVPAEKKYPFYDHLCGEAGVGKRVPHLLSTFVTNKRIVDGVNGFDISFHFDLRIPELRTHTQQHVGEHTGVDGEWYREQMAEYLMVKQLEFYNEEEKEML